MVEFIPSASISASGLNGGGHLQGLDLMMSIQILLVQDYDDQLRSMGKQINGIKKAKQAYRKDIEAIQNLLLKPTKGKDNNVKIPLDSREYNEVLNGNYQHMVDPKTGEVLTSKDPGLGKSDGKPVYEGAGKNRHLVGYEVKKEVIETKVDQLKQKLETLNEQSEIMSLSLQSLANQRKIAFETVSNLVNKEHDTVATIVRNMKG